MKARLEPLAPRDAVAALVARGLRLDPTFSWLDAWQEEHARAFTVAKSAGFDILSDIHAELLKALDEGRTFEQFAGDLRPVLQAKGWWGRKLMADPVTGEERAVQLGSSRRLRTIFDVNMRVSYAAGHWAMFERNKAARPFLRYVHVDPELHQPHSRPHHARLHNLVLPVDHPFWSIFAPPNGWGCRCTLQQLSQRDVDRLVAEGGELMFEPPTIDTRPWTNWRTGEVLHVPEGVDPGWAYNPGRTGFMETLRLAERKAARGPLADDAVTWPAAPATPADVDWLAERISGDQSSWRDALTVDQREAIASYKGTGYRHINARLRDDQAVLANMDDVDHQVAAMTEQQLRGALDAVVTRRHLVLSRGIPTDRAGRYRALEAGDVVSDPGFFSSSLSAARAASFGEYMLEIRVRANSRGIAFVHFIPDVHHVEYEVLLAPGTLMRVVAVRPNGLLLEVI